MRTHNQPFACRRLKLPFEVNQILYKQGGGTTAKYVYEMPDFPKGFFYLKLVGSAGGGATAFLQVWYFASGASGPVWEGIFYNPVKQNLKIEVNQGSGGIGYFSFSGKKQIEIIGGHTAANVYGGGTIGSLTVNSDFTVIRADVVSQGKAGSTGNGYTGNPSTLSESTERPWGDCMANGTGHTANNGGFFLQYLGNKLDKIGGGGGRLTALLIKAFKGFKSATLGVLDKLLFRKLLREVGL